ncbi:MAG: ABC transporter permease subunit [Verrucomicrobiota bacterium]
MTASLSRILTLARNTLTEAVRQKVLNVLLIFSIVLVGSSVAVSQLATPGLDSAGLFDAQIKFVKDFGCGAIGLFGFFIALLSTAQLIPQELHNRTIYTILAKPVRRSEFLLGKFLGVVLLLTLSVALMTLAFAATLYWQEVRGLDYTQAAYDATPHWRDNPYLVNAYNHDAGAVISQVRDPQIIEAIVLIFAKLVMTAGIALLISTFATSSIFTIVTTFMIYLIGHLESTAREVWLGSGAGASIWQNALVGFISLLIPDMNSFTIVDEILAGNVVPWAHALNLLAYAGVYLVVLLAVSIVVFEYREI